MRDAARTRETLLRSAFAEIYFRGFRGADIGSILGSAGVTKGALYHHFQNKEALGYAVVDEVVADIMREKWQTPLRTIQDPIDALIEIVEGTSLDPQHIRCGCPLNNISQEMSPLDEGFRRRTAAVFDDWRLAIAKALREGKVTGSVASHVDPDAVSLFVIAAYEGFMSLGKTAQNAEVVKSGMTAMASYLDSLRSHPKASSPVS